jgi:hypothetical protein
MKARLMICVCMATLFSCAAHALDNKFDIILQGPWILYEYHNDSLNHGAHVLIAVAPKVNGIYHPPILSTGDGYTIWDDQGIFCLTFKDECATNTKVPQFLPDTSYPPTNLLPVHFKNANGTQTDWDLVALSHAQNLYAFILPMPNSYSNAGFWNMQFGSKFGSYKDDTGYSIGLQLHYSAGPAQFDLFKCTSLTTAGCKYAVPLPDGRSTTLANTGTLEIMMKAPEDNDICDYHVRSLHHPTLHLLDSAKLKDKNNTNQVYGYIDPARSVDINGHGHYDDSAGASCYKNDAQQNDEPLAGAAKANFMRGMHASAFTFATLLRNEKIDLQQLDDLLKQLEVGSELIAQIDKEANLLDAEYGFPRLSDLSRFAQLLNLAAEQAEKKGKREGAERLRKLAEAVATKNGADCRSAMMLATPATGH